MQFSNADPMAPGHRVAGRFCAIPCIDSIFMDFVVLFSRSVPFSFR